MLPHNHFIVAGLAISPVAMILFPEKSAGEIGEWVVIGGVVSAAVDLDIIALVLMRSRQEKRLRPFRSLIEIYRKFDLFMDTITDTGVLRTGLITHLFLSAAIILLCYFFTKAYAVPATVGTLSHILSDIRYVRRLAA